MVGAATGLVGAAIEPIQIYNRANRERFELFQEHINQAIPHANSILYNTAGKTQSRKGPKKAFDDLTQRLDTAFPKKNPYSFSRHSDPRLQIEYKEKKEELMDRSREFRFEHDIYK